MLNVLTNWRLYKHINDNDSETTTFEINLPLPTSCIFDDDMYHNCKLGGWLDEISTLSEDDEAVYGKTGVYIENQYPLFLSFDVRCNVHGYWIACKRNEKSTFSVNEKSPFLKHEYKDDNLVFYLLTQPSTEITKEGQTSQEILTENHYVASAIMYYLNDFFFTAQGKSTYFNMKVSDIIYHNKMRSVDYCISLKDMFKCQDILNLILRTSYQSCRQKCVFFKSVMDLNATDLKSKKIPVKNNHFVQTLNGHSRTLTDVLQLRKSFLDRKQKYSTPKANTLAFNMPKKQKFDHNNNDLNQYSFCYKKMQNALVHAHDFLNPAPTFASEAKSWVNIERKNFKICDNLNDTRKMFSAFANYNIGVIDLETVLLQIEILKNSCEKKNDVVKMFIFSTKGNLSNKNASTVMFIDCLDRVIQIVKLVVRSTTNVRETTAYLILLNILKFISFCKCLSTIDDIHLFKQIGVNIDDVLSKIDGAVKLLQDTDVVSAALQVAKQKINSAKTNKGVFRKPTFKLNSIIKSINNNRET